jgi:peptidoglycan/xylan/chitin deacetylase (PgdA/CDA1 family)
MILRAVYRLAAPPGPGSRLTVMIFHRVLKEPDPLLPSEPDEQQFEARMRAVRAWFNVLPLAEAIGRLQAGALPARPLAISFDDGYADNFEVALPVLRKLGLPATFFVATGFLDGGCMWNDTVIETVRRSGDAALDLSALGLGRHPTASIEDRRRTIDALLNQLKYREDTQRAELVAALGELSSSPLPHDLMMSSAQVRGLHDAGMGIGAHTVNHPILSKLGERDARAEIAQGKERLEEIVRAPVTLFAYPNGKPRLDYGAEHVAMVKALGFGAALSTAWGVARKGCDVYQIPRFTPWDRGAWKYGLRLAQNLTRSSHATA